MLDNPARAQFAVIILCALLCAGLVAGQQAAGAISGITTDDFGNPVARVEITVQNSATGEQHHAASGAAGEYAVTGLPPGVYEIFASVHGSRLFQRKNVAVETGNPVRIDARLVDANINAIGDNAFAAAAMEQRAIPTGPTPRALDGHPDLSGVWATFRQVGAANSFKALNSPAKRSACSAWAASEAKWPSGQSPSG